MMGGKQEAGCRVQHLAAALSDLLGSLISVSPCSLGPGSLTGCPGAVPVTQPRAHAPHPACCSRASKAGRKLA